MSGMYPYDWGENPKKKKDLQIFHVIAHSENIRSKVRSNFVIRNIAVKRMRIENQEVSFNKFRYVIARKGYVRTFKVIYSGVQSYLLNLNTFLRKYIRNRIKNKSWQHNVLLVRDISLFLKSLQVQVCWPIRRTRVSKV